MPGTPRVHKDLLVPHRIVGKFKVGTDATGKVLGTLPKNAIVTRVLIIVAQAFNGATPNASVLLGVAGDTDALAADTDTAANATGYKTSANATLAAGGLVPLTDSKDIIVTFTAGGGGTTTGEAYFVVEFAYPNELARFNDFE